MCHSVISGAFVTTSASLRMRLLPADRFAQFNSAAGLVSGIVNSMMIPLLGWVLDATGNNYALLYWFGSILAAFALLGGVLLYARFLHYGGVKNYVAPPV